MLSTFLFTITSCAAAWFREQADILGQENFTRATVLKVTGSNSTGEKAKVIQKFSSGHGY
jgi:hypothetical protein